MLKTAREALILSEGGAEVKSYSAAGQAILLLAHRPALRSIRFGVGRVRLVTGAMLFFLRIWQCSSYAAEWDFTKGSRSFSGWACST